ncbi:SDR family NAD(P)-dependent oxidoreductase [Eubacterium sp.]|uniref:SDR family NAD(P)-dependent oxidoreductase n=1 Tax=Eubacterium sp. TaxID=142586 RepID=UPI0026E094C3|nr:SDR family oxidoreductase [Eubacterium sp.]MDO5434519.1 SDR family oxidoreductase [Eubacterium sp.]
MGLKSYLKRGIRYIVKGIPEKYITVTIQTTEPNRMLQGKNIIITGGGRGLGYYIAKRSIQEGANVLITGRNEEVLKKAVTELGNHVQYLVFDVMNINKLETFIHSASEIFGGKKIHSLVSNAGISLHEGNFRNVTEEGWDKQMDTNLKGNYFLVGQFVQYLEKQENTSGSIVVITSERAKRSDDIPYGLTKAATSSFIQCMASKVIEKGIRINGVGPGVTASDMTGFDRNGNMYAEFQAGKRIFIPEEVAEVVNFLLSDVSNCISGEIITCNQGRHISHW